MRLSLLLLAAMAAVLSRGPSHARACGGPSAANFSALRPIGGLVSQMRYPDPLRASWGNAERDSFRFLHPFRLAHPKRMKALWQFSHEGASHVAAPSTQALDDAIAAGDWKRATAAAHRIVDDFYALPPVPAAEHHAILDRAVEIIELAPHLSAAPTPVAQSYLARREPDTWPAALRLADEARKDPTTATVAGNPRAATLRWLSLRRDFAATVPNGWADAIRKKVSASTWQRLHRDTEKWLLANLKHPLRDLVVLHQVRIHYFAGTTDDAWTILVDLLARRPVRALAEMRFLLVQGDPPADALIDKIADPLLVTGLATPKRVTPTRWKRWWALSEKHAPTPWATNLQERLLLAAAVRGAPLSPAFPRLADPPSPLWGNLRAAALIEAGLHRAANAQLARVASGVEQARLAAHAFLRRHRRVQAASVAALDGDTRRYIIEILMSDAELSVLARSSSPVVARHARLERGIRLAAKGRWAAAAKLVDSERAALWLEAHALSKAPLRLARFLEKHRGEIFHPVDYGWYRGLSYRHAGLARAPWSRPEAKRVAEHLTRTSVRWRSLVLLTGWLKRHPDDADARDVLREADRQYNRLINQGGGPYFFWTGYADAAPEVAELREVGKVIRARSP